MNVIICLLMLLICIITLSLFKKILGELGIKIVFILMSITSFLLTFKYINIWEFNINANCVTYITMFSALYLLLENKDKKETKKIINLNFLLNILCSVIIYTSTYHTQSLTDTVGINMKNVFRGIPIILISFPIITLLANYSLTIMYKKIKSLYDNLFITTVTTFLLIGIIEGVLYTLISYYNILTLKIIIELILSTYMIKLILTVIYSIILMKITKKKVIG